MTAVEELGMSPLTASPTVDYHTDGYRRYDKSEDTFVPVGDLFEELGWLSRT